MHRGVAGGIGLRGFGWLGRRGFGWEKDGDFYGGLELRLKIGIRILTDEWNIEKSLGLDVGSIKNSWKISHWKLRGNKSVIFFYLTLTENFPNKRYYL